MIKEVRTEREKRIQEVMNKCKNIQKMIDVVREIDHEGKKRGVIQYNVLEYMDTRLGKVRPHRGYWRYRSSRRYLFRNPRLPAAVSEAVLKAVVELQKAGLVHTGKIPPYTAYVLEACVPCHVLMLLEEYLGIDMYSIQLSHLNRQKPTVKLGGLHDGVF